MSSRLLLVGVGNPGAEYARNRHNIGFMAADRIAEYYRLPPFRRRFQGVCADGQIAGRDILLLKPTTYMNESGRAVGEACRFFKLPTDAVIVFHDELDLAAGRLRVKQGGGNAGHNGLRSIDAHIGPGYWRVRLGIGHPGDKDRVLGHVLADFAKADREWLEPLLDGVAEHIGLLIGGDATGFASRVAQIFVPPRVERGGLPGDGGQSTQGG